jgi:hypothetical protein
VVELHIDGMSVILECIDYEGILSIDDVQMGGNRDTQGDTRKCPTWTW